MPRAKGQVVVVGGGISGLAAAYDLARAGVPHTLIEKLSRLGGVIETRTFDDCVLESGPDSFISSKPEAFALIKDLGLEGELIGSNDYQRTTYILKKGRLVPLPEGVMMIVPTKVWPMVKSPLLGVATKIRMGLELFRQPQASADRSVAEFVVDHFGQETLDYLAEPLLSGVYGGDPREMSVASVLPRFLRMEEEHGSLGRAVLRMPLSSQGSGSLFRTLRGGLGTLVDELAKFANVRHGNVQAIERPATCNGTGFRVRVGDDWMEAERVILAMPAHAASALLGEIDGDLARILGDISYTSSLTLSLIYKTSEFDGMRAGFGFLVPKKERQRMAACTFAATKFPYRAPEDRLILRCFFGGAGDEAILDESDDAVVAAARQELSRILGLTARPLFQSISRWPRAMAQYGVGHLLRASEIKDRTASIPGLHLAGNAYDGIGIPDCIRSGREAAAEIISTQ